MGECSKTSWARARARALRYQRELFRKMRPEKITCYPLEIVCPSVPLKTIFWNPLKRRASTRYTISR